jgi:negative regulator of sigma E activity
MTGLPDSTVLPVSRDADARDFHREQLSAMMDGALSADEAKFLLRRMEHDDALADCWERWQFVGAALRGQTDRALPADFSRRVGRAIADDLAVAAHEPLPAVAAQGHARGPLLRWGGGAALAASVALAALIGTRMLSVPDGKSSAAASTATAAVPVPVPTSPQPTPIPMVTGVAPRPLDHSASDSLISEAGAAVALAALSSTDRRNGSRPRIIAREQAIPVSSAATATAAASARMAATAGTTAVASATAQAEVTSKPWPRALVPGASMNGEVTAGFEGAPTLHPFQPQLDSLAPQVTQPVEETASPP